MAHLTQQEFTRCIEILADDLGLQRLRDRLVRMNALVTRRRAVSAERLAGQLYMLTSGLRRQVPATLAFQALWSEEITSRLGEEGEKALEKVADQVNACLGEKDKVVEEKRSDLDEALGHYEGNLAAAVGSERARLDMLIKAVPQVAEILRNRPLPEPRAAEAPAADAATAEETVTEPSPEAAQKPKGEDDPE